MTITGLANLKKVMCLLKFGHLKTKKELITGIQIDGDWLRVVQARQASGKTTVMKVSQKYLSQNYGISEFFSEHKITAEKFIISFPCHLATVRFLTLPSTNQAEIEEMVRFEAERIVPYSLEELLIDSQVITTLDNGYSQVIAVIVEKAVVDKYLLPLKEFEPESIILTSIALYNWFINSQKDKIGKTCALINVGFASADIIIVEKEILAFTRGMALSRDKRIEKVLAETTRSLDAYKRAQKGKIPEVIMLGGVREDLNELTSLMEKNFSIPVETADAFAGIDVSSLNPNGEEAGYPGANFVIPMGLVLQRETDNSYINLLPDYMREKREKRKKLRKYVTTGILSVVAILLVLSVIFHALRKRNNYLQLLMRENRVMHPLVSKIDSKRKQLELIKEQLNPGSECLQVLSELHRITPGNIFLNSMVLDVGNIVTLRGQAKELSEVFRLNSLLEKSSLFENVKVKYANKRKIKGKEITDFEIHCLISR